MSPGQTPRLPSARSSKGRGETDEPVKLRRNGRTRNLNQWGGLLSVGWNVACSIGVGLALGILFDKYLNTKPWGTMIFLLLGVASGFLNLFRVVRRLDQKCDPGEGKSGKSK